MAPAKPVLVVEDDVWLRLIGVALDPAISAERFAAFADFMSPDVPDFAGWRDTARHAAGRNCFRARCGWSARGPNCTARLMRPTRSSSSC